MSRRERRPIIYVCSNIITTGALITEAFQANTSEEASNAFYEKFNVKPLHVIGPFYNKKVYLNTETDVTLKFLNKTKKAMYMGWLVNAFLLKEPDNMAYLVFLKKMEGNFKPSNKGVITVPVSDLRILNDEC